MVSQMRLFLKEPICKIRLVTPKKLDLINKMSIIRKIKFKYYVIFCNDYYCMFN